jgi:hypothetical protein
LHARPLTRVAAGLRYFVAEAADGPVIVGQRLKRMETIRDKLERHPKMALSRIHDIGGCRAVLPNQTAVDHVIERLRAQRGWDLLDRTWDYVAEPKPDGYRAKHLVAARTVDRDPAPYRGPAHVGRARRATGPALLDRPQDRARSAAAQRPPCRRLSDLRGGRGRGP